MLYMEITVLVWPNDSSTITSDQSADRCLDRKNLSECHVYTHRNVKKNKRNNNNKRPLEGESSVDWSVVSSTMTSFLSQSVIANFPDTSHALQS